MSLWVIYNNDSTSDDYLLCWSNKDGWVGRDSATFFSDAEHSSLDLPMNGVWMEVKCGQPWHTCPNCGESENLTEFYYEDTDCLHIYRELQCCKCNTYFTERYKLEYEGTV